MPNRSAERFGQDDFLNPALKTQPCHCYSKARQPGGLIDHLSQQRWRTMKPGSLHHLDHLIACQQPKLPTTSWTQSQDLTISTLLTRPSGGDNYEPCPDLLTDPYELGESIVVNMCIVNENGIGLLGPNAICDLSRITSYEKEPAIFPSKKMKKKRLP